MTKSASRDYPGSHMDYYTMNRVLRHRLRNLCAGVKMTIERIASTTASINPQIGSRCDIIISELDNLRDFTERMDLLFDSLPRPESQSLFELVTAIRTSFTPKFPFCELEFQGSEAMVTFNHGSWLLVVLDELLANAGEAAGENGKVTLQWQTGQPFTFTITNSGDTVPAEIPTDPPVPFSTQKSRHDGLGMAIAYRILQEIGAHFELSSNAGLTEITIKLPDAEINHE